MARIVHKEQLSEEGVTEIKVGPNSILRAGAVTPQGLFVWVEHEVDTEVGPNEEGHPAIVVNGILKLRAVMSGQVFDDNWTYHSMISTPAMTPEGPKLVTWHVLQELETMTIPDELPADWK